MLSYRSSYCRERPVNRFLTCRLFLRVSWILELEGDEDGERTTRCPEGTVLAVGDGGVRLERSECAGVLSKKRKEDARRSSF